MGREAILAVSHVRPLLAPLLIMGTRTASEKVEFPVDAASHPFLALRFAAFAPSLPNAVLVDFGKCAIVPLRFAAAAAFFTLRPCSDLLLFARHCLTQCRLKY